MSALSGGGGVVRGASSVGFACEIDDTLLFFFFLIYGSNFVLCIFKILTKSGSINCSAFFSDLYLPLLFYDFP